MFGNEMRAKKKKLSKRISSHHAPDWGKIVLDNAHFFSFVLKLGLGKLTDLDPSLNSTKFQSR